MKRNTYDLSHYSIQTGDIGRLQTLACIPVIAGDSMQLSLEGYFRLSPLRRPMVVDCHLDFFAFYIPHRHIYGDVKWNTFIKDGNSESVTFPSPSLPESTDLYYSAFTQAQGFSINRQFKDLPAWIPGGYAQIWNRYFRSPTFPFGDTDANAALFDFDDASYNFWKIWAGLYPGGTGTTGEAVKTYVVSAIEKGMLCARLKRPWNCAVKNLSDDHYTALETPGTTTAKLDIIKLEKAKAEYRTEIERDFFAVRYNDVMSRVWGTHVSVDADQRPTLLGRKTAWLSGHDVDGSADANLGQFSGKSVSHVNFGIGRKKFNEHGALWIMCLPRFPALHFNEVSKYTANKNPSYRDFAGDASLLATEPPSALDAGNFFSGLGTVSSTGYIPSYQEYRYQPNYIDPLFEDLSGYPFVTPPFEFALAGGGKKSASQPAPPNFTTDILGAGIQTYYQVDEFKPIFQTDQLRNWQSQLRIDVTANRIIPGALSSVFAGAKGA